jgi:hypothetical protein
MLASNNPVRLIAKVLLAIGIGLFVISLLLPAIRFGIPFGGPKNCYGFVALISSPIFALYSLFGLGYGHVRAAIFAWVALLANVMMVFSLPLYWRILDGRLRRWLPVIVSLGVLVWFCPRDGEKSEFPELLVGYTVWAAAVSATSVALTLAGIAVWPRRLRGRPYRTSRRRPSS